MTCMLKNTPGSPCCADCDLLTADFSSLSAIQGQFTLRTGSWSDVASDGAAMEITAAGIQLLAIAEPSRWPHGVKVMSDFRGRNGSVLRFLAGANAALSVSAEISLGSTCGQLRFYEQTVSGESQIGDTHCIRELRGEEWHTATLCFNPYKGHLTLTVKTFAGETQAYSTLCGASGGAGWGVATVTDTADFRTMKATIVGNKCDLNPDSSGCEMIDCHSCQPSCAVAGYGFSSMLSACDWDGSGYTFTSAGATGTGSLSHRTEINTVPYVLNADFSMLNYDNWLEAHADAITVRCEWRRVAAPEDTYDYYIDATVDGNLFRSFLISRSAQTPPDGAALSISVCRYASLAFVGMNTTHCSYGNLVDVAALSGPGYISVDTNEPRVVITRLQAMRGFSSVLKCYQCLDYCEDGCKDDEHSDIVTVDIVGLESTPRPGDGHSNCRELNAAYEIPLIVFACAWVHNFSWQAGDGCCGEVIGHRSVVIEVKVRLGQSIAGLFMLSEWTPENDHYYLLVSVGVYYDTQLIQGTRSGIYYYAADLGTEPPDCTAFNDVRCSFRGASYQTRYGYDYPCGKLGNEVPGKPGWYYVTSNSKVYVST